MLSTRGRTVELLMSPFTEADKTVIIASSQDHRSSVLDEEATVLGEGSQ